MNFPYDLDAEKIVLGTILIEPKIAALAIQHLTTECFYDSRHRAIYAAMVSLFDKGKGIDIITVFQEIQLIGFNPGELTNLQKGVVSSAHIDSHIEILKDKYRKRELMKNLTLRLAECSNDNISSEEIIISSLDQIYSLQHDTSSKDMSFAEMLITSLTERDERKTGLRGYASKFNELDLKLNGFVPTDLIVLAGRPGQGKTAFALNLLLNLASQNIPCGFMSIEMGWRQIIERIESIYNEIDHNKLLTNNLETSERNQMMVNSETLSKLPVHLYDPSKLSITELRAKAALLKSKFDIKVLFVDYLQLMTASNKNFYERVSEVSSGLKQIAKEFDLAVIALAQLSREVEKRPDKMPQLSDLKESGQIEQDADKVIFLMRPEYYGINEIMLDGIVQPTAGKIIVKVDKNRNGTPGLMMMNWNGRLMKVS